MTGYLTSSLQPDILLCHLLLTPTANCTPTQPWGHHDHNGRSASPVLLCVGCYPCVGASANPLGTFRSSRPLVL